MIFTRAIFGKAVFRRLLAPALFVALILAVASTGAPAQTSDASPVGGASDSSVISEQSAAIDALHEKADALEAQLAENDVSDGKLVDIRAGLEDVSAKLLAAGLAFSPRLKEINARLEQLGAAPAKGQPKEPDIVASERDRLMKQKAEINALIGKAESLSLEVNRHINDIAQRRRDLFSRTLSKRYDIDFALFGDVRDQFGSEMRMLTMTITSWARYVVTFKLGAALGATFLALLAAAVLLLGGRRLFGSMIEADPDEPDPSYLSRLSVAFWSTLIPSLALTVFLFATYVLYSSYGVLREDVARLMWTFFGVVATIFFVHRLASASLSPSLPAWRLPHIETRAAYMLVWLVTAMATIMGLDFLLGTVSNVQGSPLPLAVGKSLVATVLIGVIVILIANVRLFAGNEEHPEPKHWPRAFRYFLYLLGAGTIAAALLGYIGLARFLSRQIVLTGTILVTMSIGFLSARALSAEGAFANTALGRRVQKRYALEDRSLDQLALLISVLTNLLVLIWGVPLVLIQWGFQWGDMRTWLFGIATEVHIGSVSISIIGILTGIFVFVIGYFVTRWFQRWLDGSVLSRGRVETGVRNSIRTAVGYAGIALAILVGISAAGIDLSSLALVAGALSLGIGFGLQNIVSNFVSGLILLAERPFKAGDWIVAGAVSGTVKKISVRATEIETFQRQTVILPNSELINAAVGNWTHRNSLGRIEIPVGVAYGSDVRRVHEILLEIARGHPLVLKNPDPFVLFSGFGASALDFEIRVYLADILSQLDVMNDIRFAVIDAFEKEGIEIPFSQYDLHIKSGSLPSAVPPAKQAPAEPPEAPETGKSRTESK